MYKQILAGAFMLFLSGLTARGQNAGIVPISPNMATLQQFTDYPVSYATGLAQISVPLYTIKLKDYSFPLSIDYHASGLQSGTNFSPLGLGWALNVTGFISREIRERPDGYSGYSALEMSAEDLNHLSDSLNAIGYVYMPYDRLLLSDLSIGNGKTSYNGYYWSNWEDDQHDIYTYSVNGLSGKFIIDGTGNIVQLTQSSVKITGGGDQFTITDEKGVSYVFGGVGTAPTYTYGAIENTDIPVNTGGSGPTTINVNTGWSLAQIITPSGDHINFTYQTEKTNDTDHPGDYLVGNNLQYNQEAYAYNPESGGDGFSDPWSAVNGTYSHIVFSGTEYQIAFLTNISFNSGSISFDYDWYHTYKLNSCTVSNNSGWQVKNLTFIYKQNDGCTPVLANNQSIVLSSLSMQGSTSSPSEKYAFTYNSGCNTYGANSSDWWGYLGGSAYPPTATGDLSTYSCTGCKAASGSTIAMLNKIVYPTGGTAQFTYEPNLYMDSTHAVNDGPGLRIQKIMTDDGSGLNKVTKTYKYGPSENGYGVLVHIPDPTDFYSEQTVVVGGSATIPPLGSYTMRTYTSTPVSGMADAYRQPIYYTQVTEYTQADDATKDGKTIYTYDTPDYFLDLSLPKTFKLKWWTGGKLLSKISYKYRIPQNDYLKIDATYTSYFTFRHGMIKQILLYRNTYWPLNDDVSITDRWIERNAVMGDLPYISNIYSFTNDPVEWGVELPTLESHEVYDLQGNLTLTTRTTYVYNNNTGAHISPIVTTMVTSRGDSVVTNTQHIGDVYTDNPFMTNVVENTTYRMDAGGGSKRLVSSGLTAWSVTGMIPDTTWAVEPATPISAGSFNPAYLSGSTLRGDASYVRKHVYDLYDSKYNLLEQHAENGPTTCYVWSYGGEYPVAKIENVSYSVVQTALGSSSITSFLANATPTDAALATFLAPLRSISGAQVTTYTYQPLVGMTSMTDPKGETTYYTYDSFSRLQGIWDHNKNLIKSYCYNYHGQLTACPVLFPPGQIFVQLEPGSTSSDTESDGYSGTITTQTQDMVLRFYSDAACTQPVVLNQAITVELDDYYYLFNALTDYGDTGSAVYGTYTISPDGSSTSYDIGPVTTQVDHYYYDEDEDYLDDTQTYTYSANYPGGAPDGTYILH